MSAKQLIQRIPGAFKIFAVYARVMNFILVYELKLLYPLRLRKLREKVRKGGRVEVVFLVTNTPKWKCQSVYERLKWMNWCHPRIAVTYCIQDVMGRVNSQYGVDLKGKVAAVMDFFRARGDECVLACDPDRIELMDLRNLHADIIFFQEPGVLIGCQRVPSICRHVLCCYVPYSVESASETDLSIRDLFWNHDFHRLMFWVFQWGPDMARHSMNACSHWLRAGTVLGTGHPILDYLQTRQDEPNEGYVIYAPHFSVPIEGLWRALTISTFLENGRRILAYARAHREMKWVFKPHPMLYWVLEHQAGWKHEEVESYYKSWAEIGIVNLSGEYQELFRRSKAMITDCDSFLFEYPVTGHPLIHLAFPNTSHRCIPEAYEFLHSFYRAEDIETMERLFQNVLERGEDPQRGHRLDAMRKLGLIGVDAAANVVSVMAHGLGIKECS